ncbi:MAG: hypothetical protein R3D55_28775 [Chloroflexota bacterium]
MPAWHLGHHHRQQRLGDESRLAWLVLGEDVLDNAEEAGTIQRYTRRLRENSFETVLIMRLIFLPYDLVNYLSGFLKINWRAFCWQRPLAPFRHGLLCLVWCLLWRWMSCWPGMSS